MKTIKIIDLLNMMAKGEFDKMPLVIKFDEKSWYKQHSGDYSDGAGEYLFDDYMCFEQESLNMEAEILKVKKKIEKIIISSCGNIEKKTLDGSRIILTTDEDKMLHIAYKINEIIDRLEELEKEGK